MRGIALCHVQWKVRRQSFYSGSQLLLCTCQLYSKLEVEANVKSFVQTWLLIPLFALFSFKYSLAVQHEHMQEIPHFNARSCPWSRVGRDCSYRSCDKDLLRGGCNEIKATHHPQLASKFVSRMELWLERLKDYYRATICFVPTLLCWYEPVARILPTISLFTRPKSPFLFLLVSDGRWRQWIGNWWVSDLKSNPNRGILAIESVSKEAEK